MLTQLDIYSSNISVAPYTLDLAGPVEMDPFQITNIDGLGPVAADINTSKLGTVDGEVLTGTGLGKRNIVLTLKPNPNWEIQTFEALRQILNMHFAPKSSVRLVFTTTELSGKVQIFGTVESMEPNIFSLDPEFQISIICPYPHFVDIEPIVIDGITVVGDGDSVDFPQPSISELDIVYAGTASSGFYLEIPSYISGTISGRLTVMSKHSTTLDMWSCSPVAISPTQGFEMSTVPGNKFANITRSAPIPKTSDLSRVPSASVWPLLYPGANKFQVSLAATSIPWFLTYYRRWTGL